MSYYALAALFLSSTTSAYNETHFTYPPGKGWPSKSNLSLNYGDTINVQWSESKSWNSMVLLLRSAP